jgi:hypothetical protein
MLVCLLNSTTTSIDMKGSVLEYNPSECQLTVEHAYPGNATSTPRAVVDVNVILETANSQELRDGSWINVIGYLQHVPDLQGRRQQRRNSTGGKGDDQLAVVQAVLIWDAGAIRASEYEKVMEEHRKVQREARQLHAKYG